MNTYFFDNSILGMNPFKYLALLTLFLIKILSAENFITCLPTNHIASFSFSKILGLSFFINLLRVFFKSFKFPVSNHSNSFV